MDGHIKSPVKGGGTVEKARDSDGQFVSPESIKNSESTAKNPFQEFFSEHTTYSKKQDALLDIHVGNPLRKITELLQDIKKQKAFAFTLKGSLGVMGVFLTLSVFGVFGGGQLLCDKGLQTYIGTIKVLNTFETDSTDIPVLTQLVQYFAPKAIHNRVVLIASDNSILKIPYTNKLNVGIYRDKYTMVTGEYNACSRTLTVKDASGVEPYN